MMKINYMELYFIPYSTMILYNSYIKYLCINCLMNIHESLINLYKNFCCFLLVVIPTFEGAYMFKLHFFKLVFFYKCLQLFTPWSSCPFDSCQRIFSNDLQVGTVCKDKGKDAACSQRCISGFDGCQGSQGSPQKQSLGL